MDSNLVNYRVWMETWSNRKYGLTPDQIRLYDLKPGHTGNK